MREELELELEPTPFSRLHNISLSNTALGGQLPRHGALPHITYF